MAAMGTLAFIVDLFEPREVYDAAGMFKSGEYLLRTSDPLALESQVKIRFNFPDGNGTSILGRVSALPPCEGAPYVIRLASGNDLEWLVSRAAPCAEKVGRLLAAAAQKAASRPATRRLSLGAGETGAGAEGTGRSGPRTRPISRQRAPGARPPAPPPTPAEIAPREQQPAERIAQMDEWVGQQAHRIERDETREASPVPASVPGVGQTDRLEKPAAVGSGPDSAEADSAAGAQASAEARIGALSANQKKKLAISGNRQARIILMKDEDRSLHVWVMKNPGLTEEEVSAFSAMDTLSPDALTFLLQSRRWGTSAGVINNLVLNPQTPPEAIPNLLSFLSVAELKKIVETPGVRHLVARQARRTLMERSEF